MIPIKRVPDPTYVQSEIDANPDWKLAFWLSEIDNDHAPIGWFAYYTLARFLRQKYTMEEKKSVVD